MVMQWCHEKYALPFTVLILGVLEIAHLEHDREVLDQENTTENRDEKLFFDGQGKYGDDAADG